MTRRSYGSGSLYTRSDAIGRDVWYGHWRTSTGRQLKRRIGLKPASGTRAGLTRAMAEAELRRLMSELDAPAPAGERLTVDEVARRYLLHAQRHGRKPATLQNIESEVRVHLAPYFAGKCSTRSRSRTSPTS